VTALTASAQAGKSIALRPIPWRRMAWVTWRQHRVALAGSAAVFGTAAVYLVISGIQMRDAYAAVSSCHPAGKGICQQAAGNFLNTYSPGAGAVLALLQMIPALVGAFVAAPVLARELETGTFRYAWTQSFGRTRWTIAKLVALAVAVTATALAFSALVSWYEQPLWGAGDNNGPLYPTIFDMRGVALGAWTLAAFMIGALAGILLRRVIPAMFATLAAFGGLAFVTGAFLRRHYATPLTSTNGDVKLHGSWVLSQVWNRGGKPASLDMIRQTLHAIDVQAVTPGLFQPGPATPANLNPVHYLAEHGYTLLTTYQPASRFWPFQWIEGTWLVALSLLLLVTTLWLVRRRAA
jgi:ABC-type transport system involved in multi-copper enzyme maturation permease subunit